MTVLDDRKLIGDLLRKRIDELGYRQKDLMDERLTTATISNIVTGKKKVSKDTIAYLCQKLDWELEKIPQYVENQEHHKSNLAKHVYLQVKSLETDIDGIESKYALEQIKRLTLPDDPYLLATIEFLKGKAYFKKENWEKARDHYFQAIRICDTHPEIFESNLKPTCLYGLARCYYRQNQFEEALRYVRRGRECFVKNGERHYIQFHIQISEAIYLDDLGFTIEALKVLEKMWIHQSDINTETLLNMYSLQSILYNKLKLYEEAINIINQAIETARLSKSYDHSFELWTTLGVSYKHLNEIKLAKTCFNTASRLQSKVRSKYLLQAYHYTETGKLFLSERDLKQAGEVLTTAVRLSKKANDGPRQLDAQTALGECYLLQDHFSEAVQQFHEAFELASQLNFLEQECNLTLKLAQCYENRDIIKYNQYYSLFYQRSIKLLNGGDRVMLQKVEFQPEPPDE